MDHPLFFEKFHASSKELIQKKAGEVKKGSLSKDENEWFILKGENRYGPFSYLELVKMLQEKSLYEFDFIWHQGMSSWKRVAELSEFNVDKIKTLKKSDEVDVSEVFFRRRHARAQYGASILVHNNKSVWKGQGIEISAGGAAVVIENAALQPGQILFLHFKPGDGVPPFNAICTIVNKQFLNNASSTATPVRYGVKFTSISYSVQQSIADYTKKVAA